MATYRGDTCGAGHRWSDPVATLRTIAPARSYGRNPLTSGLHFAQSSESGHHEWAGKCPRLQTGSDVPSYAHSTLMG